jgi:hypothetical protein
VGGNLQPTASTTWPLPQIYGTRGGGEIDGSWDYCVVGVSIAVVLPRVCSTVATLCAIWVINSKNRAIRINFSFPPNRNTLKFSLICSDCYVSWVTPERALVYISVLDFPG